MSASQLDRELERALTSSDKNKGGGSDHRTPPTRPKGNLGILIVLLVMAGGIVALVMTSFKNAAVYALKVDQLKDYAQVGGRRLRVEGNLVHGSLQRRDQPCEYRFTIKGQDAELPVRFAKCVVPDTFKDVPDMDVGVTVEGKLASNGSFEASEIAAKCPSKYEMKEQRDRGVKMPHQLAPVADTPSSSQSL